MPETNTNTREQFEADIVQQIRNEVQETLLLHAPAKWTDERSGCGKKRSRPQPSRLAALSTAELQSAGALQRHISQAIAETKRVIRQGGARP